MLISGLVYLVNKLCFFSSQDKFIQALLNGTKSLTKDKVSQNDSIIADIISCSTAMMRLCLKKCDSAQNPNPVVSSCSSKTKHINVSFVQTLALLFPPQSLFETLFEIIRLASLLTGLEINQTYITKTPTSTLYMIT